MEALVSRDHITKLPLTVGYFLNKPLSKGGKDKSKELVKFVTEVDTFISMYQPSVEALNSQCMSMSMSYQKVLVSLKHELPKSAGKSRG